MIVSISHNNQDPTLFKSIVIEIMIFLTIKMQENNKSRFKELAEFLDSF
jgi:hypothetical protein